MKTTRRGATQEAGSGRVRINMRTEDHRNDGGGTTGGGSADPLGERRQRPPAERAEVQRVEVAQGTRV